MTVRGDPVLAVIIIALVLWAGAIITSRQKMTTYRFRQYEAEDNGQSLVPAYALIALFLIAAWAAIICGIGKFIGWL